MAKPFSFGSVELDVTAGRERGPAAPEPDTPFRILILGDFSGRTNRAVTSTPAGRRPTLIDRDNLDDVLSKMGVELHLPLGGSDGPRLALRFRELDDFHPDRIYERHELFQTLRETRQKLSDRSTFAQAAVELQGWAGEEGAAPAAPEPAPPPEVPKPDLAGLAGGSLLDQMLEQTEGPGPARATRRPDELQAFIRRVVAPYLVPGPDPRQPEMIAQADAAISHHMRAILHHPDFQALEAAWRGLFLLVRGLETDAQLKLYLLDLSKAELAADLNSAEDLRSTAIYRLLVEQTVGTPGAEPWAVVAGNYTFEKTEADAGLLGRLARICRAAGAPFLAAAGSQALGCASLAATPDPRDWKQRADPAAEERWRALRGLPEARSIGLALPGFLLRLPYGKDTDPLESFDLEEMPGAPRHERYLWGNPAFACVYLLGQAFSSYGWEMKPGVFQQIDGLPLHTYKTAGETQVHPCAEALLTERAAEAILDQGLMPLASMKDQDAVRLVRFQSIADPPALLAGPWG